MTSSLPRHRSVICNTRLDARALADMAKFWIANDDPPASLSDLVARGFELAYNSMVNSGLLTEQTQTTEEAVAVLESLKIKTIKPATRVSLLKQIKRENLLLALGLSEDASAEEITRKLSED